MKNSILRYGSYSSLTLAVLFIIGMVIGDQFGYTPSEVFGYASMIISLLFVFIGIKHFRDNENNGLVSFGKALLIGVLISLMAALTFGIIDLIYITYINPDFAADYYAHSIEQFRATLSEAEFKVKLAELESQKDLFMNPLISFLLMTVTVFILGFIISLISSLILQRK
ncbi:DUF4199 domain-containing protein [Olleya sp. AH-315-F22]|nr:DUF4199 domain-containing protein [Olleya sp. AH-315-F22]